MKKERKNLNKKGKVGIVTSFVILLLFACLVGVISSHHTHDYEIDITNPTCLEEGFTTYTCKDCGYSYIDDYIDALGHDLIYHEGKEATCTSEGYETYYTCSRCSYSTFKEILPLGHDYLKEVSDPTCTKKGYTTYTCRNCNDTYISDYVDSLGHDLIYHEGKEATCTSEGYEDYYTCSRCDYNTYEAIPLEDHEYELVEEAPATCSEVGLEVYECINCEERKEVTIDKISHNLELIEKVDPTCVDEGLEKYYICTNCDYHSDKVELPALGHSFSTTYSYDSSYHYKVCSRCGETSEKDEHEWINYKVIEEATCDTKGSATYTCKVCEAVKEVTLSYQDHTLEKIEGKGATCTSEGYKTYYHCSTCEKYFLDINKEKEITNLKDVVIPALGHDYVSSLINSTCKEEGYTLHICSRCSDSYKSDYTEKLAHNYESKITKDPTCLDKGTTTYTCSNCSDSYEEDISALGHEIISFEKKDATCLSNGYEAYEECEREGCNYNTFKEIEATGHDFASTYSYDSLYHYHLCKNCGELDEKDEHDFDTGVISKAATCDEEGIKTYTCKVCGYKKSEKIGYEEHIITHYDKVDATCISEGNIEYWHCSTCNKYFSDLENKVEIEEKDKFISALGHNLTLVTIAPTCLDEGYTTYSCSRCDYSYESDYVNALGHSFSSNKAGSICIRCSYLKSSEGFETAKDSDGNLYISSLGTCTDTDPIIFPSTINGESVSYVEQKIATTNLSMVIFEEGYTSIKNYQFKGKTVKTLVLPKSITSIGKWTANRVYTVFYCGTAEEWEKVSFTSKSMAFGARPRISQAAKIYYFSETQPTTEGYYWHYDFTTGLPVAW